MNDVDVSKIDELIGYTFDKVCVEDSKMRYNFGEECMAFYRDDGKVFEFYHTQSCCEGVSIEDIVGNLEDLVGTPMLVAEVVTKDDEEANKWGAGQWTYYKFGTQKGYVDVRWYGSSNGYYSTSVYFGERK